MRKCSSRHGLRMTELVSFMESHQRLFSCLGITAALLQVAVEHCLLCSPTTVMVAGETSARGFQWVKAAFVSTRFDVLPPMQFGICVCQAFECGCTCKACMHAADSPDWTLRFIFQSLQQTLIHSSASPTNGCSCVPANNQAGSRCNWATSFALPGKSQHTYLCSLSASAIVHFVPGEEIAPVLHWKFRTMRE